jgi:hypothetical protein
MRAVLHQPSEATGEGTHAFEAKFAHDYPDKIAKVGK